MCGVLEFKTAGFTTCWAYSTMYCKLVVQARWKRGLSRLHSEAVALFVSVSLLATLPNVSLLPSEALASERHACCGCAEPSRGAKALHVRQERISRLAGHSQFPATCSCTPATLLCMSYFHSLCLRSASVLSSLWTMTAILRWGFHPESSPAWGVCSSVITLTLAWRLWSPLVR